MMSFASPIGSTVKGASCCLGAGVTNRSGSLADGRREGLFLLNAAK